MAVFNFPYHTFSTEYPDSGTVLTLGNSYEFASEPTAPDQRVFTLNFATMIYYLASDNPPVVDVSRDPLVNLGAMEAFWNVHKLWKTFDYPHPVYGTVKCRFAKPFKIPDGNVNGGGSVKPFSIVFKEQP